MLLNNRLLVLRNNLPQLFLVADSVLDLVDVILQLVPCLNSLLHRLVLLSGFLGFLDHPLDILLRQATLLVSNDNRLNVSVGLILSTNVQDPVDIDLEGDLNLRGSTGGGVNARQVELAEDVVVLSH
mmetsp:Transcript_13431/g.20743  ORF Transcript_13431/g.20743 Transcript_13431/m.20743 type:complete len:127 (+) Transcript_13431:346-726(+)